MDRHEKLFWDMDKHLMEDRKPSEYLQKLLHTDLFTQEYPFVLISDLSKTPQSPKHHPEGSVWNHTMLVVDNAAEGKGTSENPRVLMWAALLHDLGKVPTTKLRNGRITSYDHDKWGERLAEKFLKDFTDEKDFIYKVTKLVRWHMQILFVVKGMPYSDIETMLKEVPLNELALISLCDRLGRGNMTEEKRQEEYRDVKIFTEKCKEYMTKAELT